jgi:hypothetical protein
VLGPVFRWTSHRGETFDRDVYVRANAQGRLRCLARVVEQADVVVVGGSQCRASRTVTARRE